MNVFPDWSTFTPEKAQADLKRELIAAEEAIAKFEAEEPSTYEGFVWKLSDISRNLFDVWGMVSHMLSVMNDEKWRKLEDDFQPQMITFSLRVGQSKAIYEGAKIILQKEKAKPSPDPIRIRILEEMIEAAEHSGVALEGENKKRFNDIQAELARLTTDFSNSVLDATNAFVFEKDGKKYTIDDASYPETMKHCADREVREKLYRARSTRAPENTDRIASILKLRSELAELLGYKNYGELSLSSKCAPSVKSVFQMIDELDLATKEIAEEEKKELGENYEPWDAAYLAERLREKKYAYSEDELKQYFELEDVLKGLFKITNFLFNVDIKEVKGKDKPSVWHKDVRFFDVKENGETIAWFYFDPFVRNGQKQGGAWMNEFDGRSDRLGIKPLALIVMNAPLPDENGKVLLPYREVETIFHEFGHACQHMLTRIKEEDAAGINLVEWDAVEVASQFMENWCMDDRTGIQVPSDLKAKVKAAKNFLAASSCRRQLSFSKIDLDLHTQKVKDANEVKNKSFDHFGLMRIKEDLFLNAFTHIFAGGYAAGYYGYKWAEVMSADCFGAFEEVGLENDEKVKELGKKYRETILALGGSITAYDVFKKFRGREPNSEALLRQQGLKR